MPGCIRVSATISARATGAGHARSTESLADVPEDGFRPRTFDSEPVAKACPRVCWPYVAEALLQGRMAARPTAGGLATSRAARQVRAQPEQPGKTTGTVSVAREASVRRACSFPLRPLIRSEPAGIEAAHTRVPAL